MVPKVSMMPLPINTPAHRGNRYPDLYQWRLTAFFLPVKGNQLALLHEPCMWSNGPLVFGLLMFGFI